MRRRLYFLLPDRECAQRISEDLLLARIEDRHLHFMARRGMPLPGLHEASFLQKSDAVHGAELGFTLGAVGGLLLGIYMYLTPPEGRQLQLVMILASTIIGALFGLWASSLVALSIPNSRLKPFQAAIDAGRVLLIADVPARRVPEIQQLVHARHPDAADQGLEPTVPAFP